MENIIIWKKESEIIEEYFDENANENENPFRKYHIIFSLYFMIFFMNHPSQKIVLLFFIPQFSMYILTSLYYKVVHR